ncbi:hypothetical protein MLD38_012128 [Melastoma candidum]|uniref:Uncharacterized protein n=1 Tax=Melastoma candidum TaxID=119954 RepID=A0ACB9R5X5_9MYRT|nr:hypothetical protein MLD38_012128 [Melastoma candidum]
MAASSASIHHVPSDLESAGGGDSVASSPRSDYHAPLDYLRFMCSFGGKILPRPHDNQLRYVGGDTRIVVLSRGTSFSSLLSKLSKLSGTTNVTVKYQLPNEDLDALISVTTDEDVENMMEEYDRFLSNQNPRSARLRLFLFNQGDDSRSSSISSLLDGSANREQWFLDALNGVGPPSSHVLEHGRSEASSIVSEVPDYLFGLDNSEENQSRGDPKQRTRAAQPEHILGSDPGSPALPVASMLNCSTAPSPSFPTMPDLPPVKTRPEVPVPKSVIKDVPGHSYMGTGETILAQQAGYAMNAAAHYPLSSHYATPIPHMPVYYIPSQVPTGNMPVQPMVTQLPYAPQYATSMGQLPVGYQQPLQVGNQVYVGAGRPPMTMDPGRVTVKGGNMNVSPQVYYGVTSGGMIPPSMAVNQASGAEDIPVSSQQQPGS